MLIESFQSEKLRKLIDEKRRYLNSIKNSFHAKKVQEEILILENEILPIVLNESTLLYSESQRYVTNKMTQAINSKCDGVLFLIPLTDINKEDFKIGIANPKEQRFGNNDTENIDIDIIISSVGTHRKKIKTFTLPLWEE